MRIKEVPITREVKVFDMQDIYSDPNFFYESWGCHFANTKENVKDLLKSLSSYRWEILRISNTGQKLREKPNSATSNCCAIAEKCYFVNPITQAEEEAVILSFAGAGTSSKLLLDVMHLPYFYNGKDICFSTGLVLSPSDLYCGLE